jgi:hypothetical protein
VKQTQGVHDALRFDASQRPSAERDVESLTWHLERFRAVYREAHALALVVSQRPLRFSDRFRVRVEREHEPCLRRGQSRQAAFTATDVDYPATFERD